jgi:voltage-gated potassium channel
MALASPAPLDRRNRRGSGSLRDRLLVVAAMLGGLLVGGSTGFHLIEGWSWWDSFFMVVISASTVGYSAVHPMSGPGEAFAVVVIAGGVAVGSYALLVVTRFFFEGVVEGSLKRALARRRMEKELPTLRDHTIVCGYGHVGREICLQLASEMRQVVVVDQDGTAAVRAQDDGFHCVRGDASDELVLQDAGIRRAASIAVATSSDAINTYVVLTAKELNPNLHILARATSEDAPKRLRSAGANVVVAPSQIGGQRMAAMVVRPGVVDFFDLAALSDFPELAIEEIMMEAGSELEGMTIGDAHYKATWQVMILAVLPADGGKIFGPDAEHAIRVGDRLILAGHQEDLDRVEAALSKRM